MKMTGHLKLITKEKDNSGWQKLLAWFETLTMAFDHDPVEYTYTSIKVLREELEQLKYRVIELERNDSRVGRRHGRAGKAQVNQVGENYEY
jgi:hypothetical protein